VLGGSLDVTFVARGEADAELAEAAAFNEIDRLRAVLSTWDPDSRRARGGK